MTPRPHEELSAAIESRRGELGLSLREVAELAGITSETLRAVRKGSNEPSVLTKRGIEGALQWAPGSVDAVLAGGEPTPAEAPQAPERPTTGELAARAAELRAEADRLEREMRALAAEGDEHGPNLEHARQLMAMVRRELDQARQSRQ